MKCPRCNRNLRVIYFDDGTHAGYCAKCRATYSLVPGVRGLELSRQYYWLDKEGKD